MKPNFDPTAALRLSDDAIAAEVAGEVVLISIASGQYFGLDSIGSDIWRRLETPKSLEALCAELKDSYDGDGETIARDTRSLIETLLDRGLVTQVD